MRVNYNTTKISIQAGQEKAKQLLTQFYASSSVSLAAARSHCLKMTDSLLHESSGLLLICLFMFLGCFLTGSLPLSIKMSEKTLNSCNALGAGLLVGTALAVIIPEGFHSLFAADAEAAAAQAALATAHASGNATETTHNHADTHEHSGGHGHSHGADGESGSTHGMAGFVMVAGFLFQMLVDKLLLKHGGHAHGSSTASPDMSSALSNAKKGLSATVGLVVHSAADGFAMGAASAAGNSSVELLVFAAIMLHKGPAAFGLVAFLLSEGLDKRKVKEYLLAFSFAAPVMAIVTFVLIKVTTSLDASTELGPGFGFSDTLKLIEGDANGAAIPQGVSESQHDHAHDAHGAEATQQTSSSIIGLALLFSAGTFLYVATIHVLPELTSKHGGELSRRQLMLICLGICLPPLLSIGHHH